MEDSREETRSLLHDRIGCTERSLNVAVIGSPGSGKSSFLNSVFASFSGEYRERVAVGSHGGSGRQVTHRIKRMPKEKYLKGDDILEYSYPTLYDMAGFENNADGLSMNLLELVFHGRLPDDEKLRIASEEYKKNGCDGLRRRYPPDEESPRKIDRIIFIASAKPIHATESKGDCYPVNDSLSLEPVLPVNLINAVINVAREGNREIPIYGVLSHGDSVDINSENYKRFEKEFCECLGIPKTRFLLCTNYCDDYFKKVQEAQKAQKQPIYQTYLELDLPITEFMTTVLDRALEVVEDKQTNEEGEHKSTQTKKPNQGMVVLVYFVQSILIAIIMFWILSPPLSGRNMSEMCGVYNKQTDFKNAVITNICESSNHLTERRYFPMFCLMLVLTGTRFALDHAVRRFTELDNIVKTLDGFLE